MSSSLRLQAFFALLLLAAIADGRKDPGEYWASVMKEEPIPEAIQGLIHANKDLTPHSGKKTDHDCKTSTDPASQQNMKPDETTKNYNDEFEPRPNLSAYGGDKDDNRLEKKPFLKDFEPRPNLSAYGGDKDDNRLEKKPFLKDFEPRPNLSAYGNADTLEGEKSDANDFKSRPGAKSNADGADLKGEKPFVKDFEPRPNILLYQG